MNFTDLKGDDLGVYHDENYRLVQCCGGHITFSYSQKGDAAMTAHFAADKIGLINVKEAINRFCLWIFKHYIWCRMIFAVIDMNKQSVVRLVKKCGFEYLIDDSKHHIYVRYR